MPQGKVLICDDSVLSRKQISDIICDEGEYEIIEATNGEEVVEIYKAEAPDLVFLDIVMPKKDGVQAVKEIIEINKDAKIVMVSSIGNKKYLTSALQAGAKEFIQKPVDEEQLRHVLNVLL